MMDGLCVDCPIPDPRMRDCWECNRIKLAHRENE